MKKVHLGLDLGIASVGWSLVDEDQNIIATGSHLFPKLSDPKDNKKYGEGTRGQIRRTRRMSNRKKQRKIDFLNMIDIYNDNNQFKISETGKPSSLHKEEYQKIFGFTKENTSSDFLFNEAKKYDIYKIWRKGLEQEIAPKELFLFLYFKLGLRGVFFKSYQFDQNKKYTYEDSLLKTIYEDVYYKKNGKYRNQSNGDLSFSIHHNWKDIETILNNCSYLTNQFIEDYKRIFYRHREFSKGPGNFELKDKQSKWGIVWDDETKTKEEIERVNLWDKKIGVCPISLYKNKGNQSKAQKRLNQFFCIAELANIISQLVYIKVGNSVSDKKRLTRKQIINIINESLEKDERITKTKILKLLNVEEIDNYPTTKDGKSSNFEPMEKVRKYYSKDKGFFKFDNNKQIDIQKQYESLDHIDSKRFEVLTKYFEKDSSKDNKEKTQNRDYLNSIIELKQKCSMLENVEFELDYERLANFNDIKEADLNGTRNYGLTAYSLYLQNFFNTNDEKLESFVVHFKEQIDEGAKLTYHFNNNSKYIPENLFKEQDFISPNATNTLKETIRVINKTLRQYVYKNDYELESIMLETTWSNDQINESLLSEEKRKEIIDFQKNNEKNRKIAIEELNKNGLEATEKNIKRYILWVEQDRKDIYTGKSILIKDIINYQVDHIVPESISFNSNLENLALTLDNSAKGNKLAREFVSNNKDLIQWWNDLYNNKNSKEKESKSNQTKKDGSSIEAQIKYKKLKNLMMERSELNKKNFINSNLTETTYAIRKAKDALTFFIENFNNNYIDKNANEYKKIHNCDIRTINGFQSQLLRNNFFRLDKKNREISNHHSHDASMIAMFSSFKHINDFYNEIKSIGSRKFILEKYGKTFNYISIKDLDKIISNTEELKNRILDSKCIYSFKKVTILPKGFEKLSNDEKWEKIKAIKPKQIFSNQNVDGYVEIDGNKHKVEYMKLNDKDNNSTNTKMITILKDVQSILKDIDQNNIKEIRNELNKYRKNGNNFAKKIITEWNILYMMYKCVENYIDDLEIKKDKTEWPFERYVNELREKNILNGLNERGKIINNNEYIESILRNYIPLIDSSNSSFIKISRLKYINSEIHSYSKEMYFKKLNNKSIFNSNKYKQLSRNTTIYGNKTKLLVILKYKVNKKDKIDIYKINWLNQVVDAPKDYQIIEYIDPNKWYLIDNEIYRVGSLDIDRARLYIEMVSIANKKERKAFNKWSKYEDSKIQEQIFNKIICQGKKII